MDISSEGLGEMIEGDSADMFAGKFPLMLMGGGANGQVCADSERGPPWGRPEILCRTRAVICNKLAMWGDSSSSKCSIT